MNPVAILAAILGLAACFTDLRSRQIPNWIPAAGLIGGVAIHGWLAGWRGAGMSLLAAGCGFLAFLLFYLLGGMGGGDVKLTAGFGAVLGWPAVLQALLFIAIVGALAGTGAAIWQLIRARGRKISTKVEQDSIPYAPAIAAGVWITIWVRS
jgi:prepilin peptidase CpaA